MMQAGTTVEWLTVLVLLLTGAFGVIAGIALDRAIGRIRRRDEIHPEEREGEPEYRTLFENAHDAMLLFDARDHAILDVNEQATILYGYTRAEFIGRSVLDLAVDRQRALERILAQVRSSDSAAFESEHRRRDGAVIDVELSLANVAYRGRPAILITNRDVSARNRAERAVRANEERFRLLLDALTDHAIVTLDLNGCIVSWNEGAERITGFVEAEVLGKSAEVFLAADEGEGLRSQLAAAASSGSDEREVKCVRSDGEPFAASVTLTRIVDGAGALRGYALVTRDITARARLEQMREELLRVLESKASEWTGTFDAVQLPIVLIDRSGGIRRLNRAAQKLAGQPFASLIGTRTSELPGEPWQTIDRLARNAFEADDVEPAQTTSGRSVWRVSCAMAGMYDTRRAIAIAYDLTELERLQASLRRNEVAAALGSLVAAVAHEVRNPLFTISATLDAWEARYGLSETTARYRRALREQVDRLNRLMSDLLEYGKPSRPLFSEASLSEVIRSAGVDCGALAAQRDVEIIYELDEPGRMTLDPGRMEQVFQNVIDNAIRHSPNGAIVRVTAVAEGEEIVCRVIDEGLGLGDSDPEAFFVPMFTRRRGGTGLGLAIARNIVSVHEGTITIGNRTDADGAVVTIRLSLRRSPAHRTQAAEATLEEAM